MLHWPRITVITAAVALLLMGAAGLAGAQSYGPPNGPARVRTVQSEPAVACQNEQDLGRVLTAYYNGNRGRAHTLAAQSCAILTTGTRVAVLQRPTSLNISQRRTGQTVTYRDVAVRVLDGPSRGYVGYIVTDTIK